MDTINTLQAALKNAEKQGKQAKQQTQKAYWLGRAIALQDALRLIKTGNF